MNRARHEEVELDEPFPEQHAVAVTLLVVGALGIVIGFVRPDRSVELSLGLLMAFFVLRSMIVGAWPARGAARSVRTQDRRPHR